MTRSYSNDLRERVVAVITGGEICRSVADRFGIAPSSVIKWSEWFRETGNVVPCKMGGHRRVVLEPYRDFIVVRIAQTSHLMLHWLRDELASRGETVSHNVI